MKATSVGRVKGSLRPASVPLAVAVAVACSALATVVALPLQRFGRVTVASMYMLAVVGAAAIGGLWSGLGAAMLSFLGLNFLFTPPLGSFRIGRVADVVALLAFLVVAAVVGWLLATAIEERSRAARREQEARLLGYVSSKLLQGEPLDRLLADVANALLEPFSLARAEISIGGDPPIEVVAQRSGAEDGGAALSFPIVVHGEAIGSIVAVRRASSAELDAADERLLQACARQVAASAERMRLDTRVRRATLESETSELRAALFSSVTHDLRTPLASIKAAATSLLDPEAIHDDEQQRELLATIREETDRLNRLLGNILDLAKIRAGALNPAKEPTPIEDVIESVLHRMKGRLGGVRIRTVIRPELPEVPMDPVQIDQVLTNLLENAARYSPTGAEITLVASLWHASIQVRVVDQGPGVPPEERERVFEPFYRGPGDMGASGSGLGLAIARAIVLAHGGKIWIEGTPGGGAAVVFELPIHDKAPAPQEPRP